MAKQDLYSMHGTVNLKLLSENSFTIITAFISVLSRKRTLLKRALTILLSGILAGLSSNDCLIGRESEKPSSCSIQKPGN